VKSIAISNLVFWRDFQPTIEISCTMN